MDPTEKGWFLKYLEIRDSSEPLQLEQSDKFMYSYFQSSGIMYGHPLNLPSWINLNTKGFPVKERMKLILAESLIFCIEQNNLSKSESTNSLNMDETISSFYTFCLECKGGNFNLFSFKNDKQKSAEYFLNKRIQIKSKWITVFWNMFFYNVLLYSDVLQFVEWLKLEDKSGYDFHSEMRSIRLNALKVIALAANCDQNIADSELKFYNYFLESAELKNEDLRQAKGFLKEYSLIENFQFDEKTPWLQRKYLLDLAILSLWADKNIEEFEQEFLEKLCAKLNLDNEELTQSQLSIESFVLNNWEKIHFLQSKQTYTLLSSRLIERLKSISFKYKNQISNEIGESKELVELLAKSTNHDLSVEEKEKIRKQLIDVMKSIPAFVYLSLPFTFFTLPVIFKILPKSVFPSSFDENKLMQRKNRKTIG